MGLLFGSLLLSLFAVGEHHVNAHYTGAEKYRGEDVHLTPFGSDRYGHPVELAFRGGPPGPNKPILFPVKRGHALGGTIGPIKPIPILAEPVYPVREPPRLTKPVSDSVEANYPQWEPIDQMKPAPLPVKFIYPGPVGPSYPPEYPQTERVGPRHPLPGSLDSHRGPKMIQGRFFTSVAPRKPVYKAKRPSESRKYPHKPRYLTIQMRYVPRHPS